MSFTRERQSMRRKALLLALLSCAPFTSSTRDAAAQSYPNRPVRLIVPYAPGGGTDILARALAPRVSEALGQTLVIENRPGAGGNIGADAVAKSAPDGYTLLMAANTIAINAGLAKLPFDPLKDFAPVTMLATAPMLLLVHPSVNAKTTSELIAASVNSSGACDNCARSFTSLNENSSYAVARTSGTRVVSVAWAGLHSSSLVSKPSDVAINQRLSSNSAFSTRRLPS